MKSNKEEKTLNAYQFAKAKGGKTQATTVIRAWENGKIKGEKNTVEKVEYSFPESELEKEL